MRSVVRLVRVLFVALVVGAPVLAGAAKGKPFVQLEGQIVEVQGEVSDIQDQVESLVAQVSTIDERIVANESAIATLETANDQLEALVLTSSTDIASIQATIYDLQTETTILQQELTVAGADVSALEQQIAHNQALVVNLQSALAAVQNGVISLETDLQAQIDQNVQAIQALQLQIDDIQSILALKQDHLDGQCGEGYALQTIHADGSIFCTSTGTGGLEVAYTQVMFGVNYLQHRFVSVSCDPGWLLTGGGFRVAYFIQPTRVAPVNGTTAEIGALNWENINNTNFAYAFCARLAP